MLLHLTASRVELQRKHIIAIRPVQRLIVERQTGTCKRGSFLGKGCQTVEGQNPRPHLQLESQRTLLNRSTQTLLTHEPSHLDRTHESSSNKHYIHIYLSMYIISPQEHESRKDTLKSILLPRSAGRPPYHAHRPTQVKRLPRSFRHFLPYLLLKVKPITSLVTNPYTTTTVYHRQGSNVYM